MTLSLADAALLVPLAVFTVHDMATKTLPLWLTLPALALAWLGNPLGLWSWSFASAFTAFAMLWLAGLPAGDQKAVAVVAGFLTLPWAIVAVEIALLAAVVLLLIGRRYDLTTVEWPFFPWIAGSVLAVRMIQ